MPRKGAVEDAGLGEKVLELSVAKGMSIPAIQRTIQLEDGVFLSTDSLRGYLERAPPKLMEQAKETGLVDALDPILSYADKLRKFFDKVESLADRALEAVERDLGPDGQEPAEQALMEKYKLSAEQAKEAVRIVRARLISKDAAKDFLAATAEARKMMELAAKMDRKLQPGPGSGNGGVNVKNGIILTGQDLLSMVTAAREQPRQP